MYLSEILKKLPHIKIKNFLDSDIECITHNSKDCEENSMFFCISGSNFDGSKYISEATERGAVCIVSEREIEDVECTQIIVKNIRIAMSIVAKIFYGNSDEKLKIIGVVGTNGKTTTSMIIANILKEKKHRVGIIGTNGIFVDDISLPNNFTTPDPIDLHYTLYQLLSFGVEFVIMEVSAHAIYYNKVYGIKFDIGVFTNISNEHLDFFKTMENYSKTKLSFFSSKNLKECVVNIDDEYGKKLARKVDIPCISYGIANPANVFAIDITTSMDGSNFVINLIDDVFQITSSLVGDYNIYNLLAAITTVRLLNLNKKEIVEGVKKLKGIEGRFNTYSLSQNRKIIVDFAHTPDGIQKVLSLTKLLRKGRIFTIFGCVGYSDRDKRIEMGRNVSIYSDKVIISTDNSDETPFEEICKDIKIGVEKSKLINCIEDRKSAIQIAVKMLSKNDTLVILGKGAEKYQKIKGKMVYHSDIETVEEILKNIENK